MYARHSASHPGEEMKKIIKTITVIALLLIMLGGAALDSEDIRIPVCMVLIGVAWLCAIAWANREETVL